MAKEQDCTYYFPGDVTNIDIQGINSLLKRTKPGDNERRTERYYIYANDTLLGGK